MRGLERLLASLENPSGPVLELDADVEPHLSVAETEQIYRIVREALSNAVRHAGATRVAVRVRSVEGATVVAVADDGVGMDVASAESGGLGLASMRDRAARLAARFDCVSIPGVGTTVVVGMPKPVGSEPATDL